MYWNNESVLKFIGAYKKKDVLWDPSHKNYYNKNLKQESWEELSVDMGCTVNELKKKMDYLLAALRREKAKMTKSSTTGKGADEVYQSTWFAYKYMEFLINRNKPRQRINTESQDCASKDCTFENEENCQKGQDNETEYTRPPSIESPKSEDQTVHHKTANPSKSVFKSPIPKKRKYDAPQDPMLQSAFDLLKSSASAAKAAATVTAPSVIDQYQLYANYLAGKFRGYSKQTYIALEHQINGLLYHADCGQYEGQRGCYSTQASSSYSVVKTTRSQMLEAPCNSYRAQNPAPSMVENQLQPINNSPASEINYSPGFQLDESSIDSEDSFRSQH